MSHGRVNILKPKFNLNEQIGLFIVSIINQEKYKYSYGRGVFKKELSNMLIPLPIKFGRTGEPMLDMNAGYSDDGFVPD